jgi:hypothetical protein
MEILTSKPDSIRTLKQDGTANERITTSFITLKRSKQKIYQGPI